MTTRRVYECDFCRTPLTKEGGGIGLYWSGDKHGPFLVIRPLYEAQHYLCGICKDAFAKLLAASAPGDGGRNPVTEQWGDPPATMDDIRKAIEAESPSCLDRRVPRREAAE